MHLQCSYSTSSGRRAGILAAQAGPLQEPRASELSENRRRALLPITWHYPVTRTTVYWTPIRGKNPVNRALQQHGVLCVLRETFLVNEPASMIRLSGDLDLSWRDAVKGMLPSPGSVEKLVIDCSGVASIESVVIAEFMRYRRDFIAAGRDPLDIIFIVSPQMRRTFDITGMSEWFTVINAPSGNGRSSPP